MGRPCCSSVPRTSLVESREASYSDEQLIERGRQASHKDAIHRVEARDVVEVDIREGTESLNVTCTFVIGIQNNTRRWDNGGRCVPIQFPEHLAKHSSPHIGIAGRETQAADEAGVLSSMEAVERSCT